MTGPTLKSLLPDELKNGLTSAEKTVLERTPAGKPADLSSGKEEDDKPSNADHWGKKRTVRAEFLYWLCTDPEASQRIHAKGVRIGGAKIIGALDFRDAVLPHPLGLIGCAIPDGITLSDARARSLNLFGSRTGPISADRLKTTGSVFLTKGFHAEGEVRLLGADIGGDLACTGATFKNPKGAALSADGLKTTGSVSLKDIHAEGEVRLPGADIGGQLSCTGATFNNPKGSALSADRLKTTGDVFLTKGFHAEGEVRLLGADIGGQLSCIGATFNNPEGKALNAVGMRVNEVLFWRDLKNKPQGIVNLMHARVGQLADDEKSWPDAGKLSLDGFEYKAFVGSAPQTAVERLRWLRLQLKEKRRFWPQPYEQLAKVFRNMGHESDARAVLIAKQEDLRKYGQLSWKARLWNRFLGETISHGYRPWKVLYYIGFMIVLGWFLFIQADERGVMQPSRELVYLNAEFIATKKLPELYPVFSPLIYSIDTFFPFVDLHQESYWLPSISKPSGLSFKVYLWFHIGMGWLLSTFAVAALTGLIRKDRSNSLD